MKASGRRRVWLVAAATALLVGARIAPALAGESRPSTDLPASIGHSGRWITDENGRVLITHGVNMVYKLNSYAPDEIGFDDDDAAFLAEQGLDSVRLGVIWKAVEPQPGRYDDAYLNRIEHTARILANHGIVSLIDMHQDQYNERFEGEGAPDWAVQDDGLPAWPKLGFGPDYVFMLALNRAYDHFWANDPAPDGVGLQDHYAAAWAHVAAHFANVPGVLGYDLFNEPWPGSGFLLCANPFGCPSTDTQRLAPMHAKVATEIRKHDRSHMLWYEPFVIFNNGAKTSQPALTSGGTKDPRAGLSFHDYCLLPPISGSDLGCDPFDDQVFANAEEHSAATGAALMLTEYGASDRADEIDHMVTRSDERMIPWQYWAYTGFDPTTSGPSTQALVLDPAKPKTGDNVKWDKLRLLAIPHPKLVAGTPASYGYDRGQRRFRLTYTTARAGGGTFAAGSVTTIAVPKLDYPDGYQVAVTGAKVLSAQNAPVLELASLPAATTISVTVSSR